MKNINISIINDEISDNLEDSINFCIKNKLNYIDIRSINKKNILSLDEKDIIDIKTSLDKNGISVSGVSSPLFKWFQNKQPKITNKIDLFYYDPQLSTQDKYIAIKKIFKYCEILESPYLRIFSGLPLNSEFNSKFYEIEKDLFNEVEKLSKTSNIKVGIENEPVCNINSLNHLLSFRELVPPRRIKLLLDIGNLYYQSENLEEKNLTKLLDYILPNIHLKDFSKNSNSYVKLGDGDIPYGNLLKTILEKKEFEEIFLTLEPHTGQKIVNESDASIPYLRKLLEKISF